MSRLLIATNTLYQLASRLSGVASSFLLTLIITKSLGAYQFGQFVKIITFVGVFYTPLDFGINAVALKLFTKPNSNHSRIFSELLTTRLFLALLFLFLSLFITALLPGTATNGFTQTVKLGILILSFTLFAQAAVKSTNAVFQHHLSYQFTLATDLVQGVFVLASAYLAVSLNNILPIIVGYLLGGFAAAAIQLLFVSRFFTFFLTTPDLKTIKKLLLPALPLGITLILSTLHLRTDLLVLSVFRPTVEVGVYGLSKKIFETILVIPTFFTNSLYPFLLRFKGSRLTYTSSLFMLLIALLATVAIFVSAPLLTRVKPEFAAGIGELRLLGLTLPLFFVTAPLMWHLISLGKDKVLVPIYTLALIVNAAINLLFVPRFGALASIVGLAVSETSTLLLLLYFVSQSYGRKLLH